MRICCQYQSGMRNDGTHQCYTGFVADSAGVGVDLLAETGQA